MVKRALSVLFIFATIASHAQGIANDSSVAGLGVRLGIYSSKLTNLNPSAGSNLSGNGTQGAILYTLSYDQGTSERFTVGGQFRYNSFLLSDITSSAQTNVAYGVELAVTPAYHFARNKNSDLYVQALIGGAFVELANTNYQESFSAEGLSFGLELGARFYIDAHFGVQLDVAYSGYEFPDGHISPVYGYLEEYSFSLNGVTFGVGLCYKFHSKYKT